MERDEWLHSDPSCSKEEHAMAKGQMRPNKETRKPKKDAKKPAGAAASSATTATKAKGK